MKDPFRSQLQGVLESRNKIEAAELLRTISADSSIEAIGSSVLSFLAPLLPDESLARVLAKLESPIEMRLLFALSVEACIRYPGLIFRVDGREYGFGEDNIKAWMTIEPQVQIRELRVDFRVELAAKPLQFVDFEDLQFVDDSWDKRLEAMVVECDGHEFHEKTVEQATRDKARDRLLQSCGLFVFRYTGSDIFNRCFDNAKEICKHLELGVAEKIGIDSRELQLDQ